MKCGIIGLPNVGKSTIFNCLSINKALIANFPFSTINPNIACVQVPDNRLIKLNNIVKSKKIIHSYINIIDIAGLVKGAHKGEGLGNRFLDNIKKTQAMIHVIRCFQNPEITHVEGMVNPIRDKEIIDIELQLKDLEVIQKKINKLEQLSLKKKNDSLSISQYKTLKYIEKNIILGKNIRDVQLSKENKKNIQELQLLTIKPILYLCNLDEKSFKYNNNKQLKLFTKYLTKNKELYKLISISGDAEYEISKITNIKERQFFLKENLALTTSVINTLIRNIYNLLNLQTFFTVSKKEIRAWEIKKNSTALQAAAIIHDDFKKGFICVEVIKYEDYMKYDSLKQIKEKGKFFIQGRNYIIEDGDILKFRFNV
jgi:hypothetical protein